MTVTYANILNEKTHTQEEQTNNNQDILLSILCQSNGLKAKQNNATKQRNLLNMTITVMQQRQGVIRTLVVLLFFCLTTTTAQRTNPCPSDPATSGYTTISDINLDLQDAADLVLSGDIPPILPLLYPICPDSALIFEPDDVPIQPRLDASFTCGIDGAANNCQIQGGTTQFLLRGDTAFPDLGLSNVTMRGIIFSAFTEASIAVFGSAEIDVDVVLEECSWTVSS